MIRALHADHALSYRFLSYLISRNIRLEEDLVDQVSHRRPNQGSRVGQQHISKAQAGNDNH
jgi:hypothetical protein